MSKEKLSPNLIIKTLDWSYEKAINGVPGFDSAAELAEDYLGKEKNKIDAANTLIRWQNSKAATSGFVTGVGGLITLPVAVPANIASVLYLQVRMIAAIAHMGGYDLKDDRVKTLVYACMAGNSAKDLVKGASVQLGTRLGYKAVQNISSKSLMSINQRIGLKLFTKFGSKGIINLGRMVPVLGGVICASFDGITTNVIGNTAKDAFLCND